MDNTPKKTKYGVYLAPETMEKVEQLYKGDSAENKSVFIERAIHFYCGYLTAENYRDYLPKVMLSTVQGTLDSFENRMAGLLFKMAVELSVLNRVTAATIDVGEFNLTRTRGRCIEDVKRINGCLSFDQAVKDEENK